MKKHFQARLSEWFNGLLLMGWGAYLILHPGIFSGPVSPVFEGMQSLASQEVWGFGAFVVGSVRSTVLFINGKWGVTPIIRVVTSFLSVFVWFCIVAGLYCTGIPQTGTVIYSGLMFLDMYSASQAAADAYESEASRRLTQQVEGSSSVVRFGRK